MTTKEQKRLWLIKLENHQLFCALCGEIIKFRKDLSKDHIVAKSRGGANSPSNYQPAHKQCNFDKGAMSMKEWKELQNGR